ncbi:hypothetical protein CMI37_31015 [Candidatus Pacearchaeota archaeon]|nr:hypothetical protein [Candidatus Pacearchaeota archaeon]
MAEGFGEKPTVTVGSASKKSDYDNLVDFVAGSEWLDGNAGLTFVVGDFGKTARVDASGNQTINLPSVSASNIGGRFAIVKLGAGNVTIQAADSDTIADGAGGGTLTNSVAGEDYACVVLELAAATEWVIVSATGSWATSAQTFKYGVPISGESFHPFLLYGG